MGGLRMFEPLKLRLTTLVKMFGSHGVWVFSISLPHVSLQIHGTFGSSSSTKNISRNRTNGTIFNICHTHMRWAWQLPEIMRRLSKLAKSSSASLPLTKNQRRRIWVDLSVCANGRGVWAWQLCTCTIIFCLPTRGVYVIFACLLLYGQLQTLQCRVNKKY